MIYHPVEDLSSSLHAALLRDLPPIIKRERDWDAWNRLSVGEQKERNSRARKGDQSAIPMASKKKRPFTRDVTVQMFSQTWPTTSMGFSTPGTAGAMPAYSVIVEHEGAHAVYFGGRFAYIVMEKHAGASRVDAGLANFKKDMASQRLVNCIDAIERYKAIRFLNDAAEEEE